MCLNQEKIKKYLSGNCTGDELDAVEEHLRQCEKCRQQVESAKAQTLTMEQANTGQDSDRTVTIQAHNATESMPDVSMTSETAANFVASVKPTIKGYTILENMPQGGQAIVYKAFQKATNRLVAVKVLLHGARSSPRHQYRFEREVRLAASLHHPNIVAIHDSGIADGQYYYVMKYVEGKPLDDYIESNNLSLRQTMELFEKVCSASAYAHQKGVMHRDLKPGNVLVDNEGEPHILDFGLAKMVNDPDSETNPVVTSINGQVIGTLAFMSPEQATGNQDKVDIRTDVYSIGVMLYQVLTGQFPYDIDGPMLETLKNIRQADPVKPSKLTDNLNSEIEAIVMKSLDKDPSRRYQSAAHLKDDINCWLNGLPVTAKADSSLYILRKLLIKHRYASMVAGLLLVIILSFSFISFDLFITAQKARRKAESLLEQVQIEKASENKFAIQLSFYVFLEAWRVDNIRQAQTAARLLPEGTRENTAMKFLVDSRPIAEKEKQFRTQLPNEHQWFADFIIAENHLKNGNHDKAVNHYQLSLDGAANIPEDKTYPNRWHIKEMKARLYELNILQADNTISSNKSE